MTPFQKYLLAVCSGFLFFAGLAVSFALGRKSAPGPSDLPVSVRVDTLVVRDTIREKYPVFQDRWHERTELVQVTDTIRLRDTLYLAVEIESREYGGKEGDDYRAVVSGFRPSLDLIEVYPKTVYVQNTVETQQSKRGARLGFGATAGPAVIWTPDAGVKAGAGVAAGVTICF